MVSLTRDAVRSGFGGAYHAKRVRENEHRTPLERRSSASPKSLALTLAPPPHAGPLPRGKGSHAKKQPPPAVAGRGWSGLVGKLSRINPLSLGKVNPVRASCTLSAALLQERQGGLRGRVGLAQRSEERRVGKGCRWRWER